VSTEVKNYEFKGGIKSTSMALIAVGIISVLVSFSINPVVGWVDYLVNTIYFVTVAASGIFFLAVTGVLQASWMTPYKRIPEAMTKFLPVGLVLMLVTYFGLHTIYEWTHTDVVMNDPILKEKVAWLNTGGFMFRMVLIFVIWIFLASKFRSLSAEQDNGANENLTFRTVRFSAIGLILFSLSICVAAFDWMMSIEPHWFSTIYGVYAFAGTFVSGIAFTTIAVIKLREWGYLHGVVTEDHLHDLGKWMFGFSIFWAYIWLSQYLLIWYANIPEETEYYVLRSHHGWSFWFYANLVINWVAPFFLLMTRGAKRNPSRLKLVAMILLVGHLLDLYIMVAPMVFHHHDTHISGYGILQILQWLGFAGLFIFVVGNALAKNKLVSENDPNYAEGVHLHQ
jgi:hypothetical protein